MVSSAPRRRPAPPSARPGPAGPVDVLAHLKWARAIARGVRGDFRFGKRTAEEADLEGVAYLELVKAAARFRPERVPAGGDAFGAFRGFAAAAVRSACRREARRLRNAGTYHTRRENLFAPVEAIQLSRYRDARGDPVEFPDPRPDADPADAVCGGDDAGGHAARPPARPASRRRTAAPRPDRPNP